MTGVLERWSVWIALARGDVSLSNIATAEEAVNRGFDACRFFVSCGPALNSLYDLTAINESLRAIPICSTLGPVTVWNIRNGKLEKNTTSDVPDVDPEVIDALARLGLPANVGGLAELEKMANEGYAYLGGAERDTVFQAASRVFETVRGADLVSLCK